MIVIDTVKAPEWAQLMVKQINQAFDAIRADNAVKITGGTIDGTPIGGTTPAAGSFTTTQVGGLTSTQTVTLPGATPLLATTAALTSGAGGSVGTLNNAPAAGNPTKWVAINDAGTTRYFPAW